MSNKNTNRTHNTDEVLSSYFLDVLRQRFLPDKPPATPIDYFFPFDESDPLNRPLKFAILRKGGSDMPELCESGSERIISLAKCHYSIVFKKGEAFDGPAYHLFSPEGRHYMVYSVTAVRDIDVIVSVFGYPPYDPPLTLTFEHVVVGGNRMYRVGVVGE